MLEQSEGLRCQYQEILRKQLSPSDEIYSDFVKKLVAKNPKVNDANYMKSMPLNRKREDLTENPFSFKRIVEHIENEKQAAGSEQQFRLVHSDQSGQLVKSNSVRQSYPSITSPSCSLGHALEQAKMFRAKHRMKNSYNSKSHQLINRDSSK